MNHLHHVAIIMDGNGRWGIKKKKSRNFGHKAGLNTVEKIIKSSIKNKVKYLTLYAFSTENWKRPKNEIKFLFNLLDSFIDKKINEFIKNNIRFKVIGDISVFNKKLQKKLNDSEKITLKNKKLQVNLALNYGSKVELIRAFKRLNEKRLNVNLKNLEKNLYTAGIPDPEILIRTGNTHRLSNFFTMAISIYRNIF
jgi:undecaprenyl diphosphate synthase